MLVVLTTNILENPIVYFVTNILLTLSKQR